MKNILVSSFGPALAHDPLPSTFFFVCILLDSVKIERAKIPKRADVASKGSHCCFTVFNFSVPKEVFLLFYWKGNFQISIITCLQAFNFMFIKRTVYFCLNFDDFSVPVLKEQYFF